MTVLEKSIKLNLGNVLCVLKLIILHYDFNFDKVIIIIDMKIRLTNNCLENKKVSR